jgi:hypothetical protein
MLGVALERITSAFNQRWHDGIFLPGRSVTAGGPRPPAGARLITDRCCEALRDCCWHKRRKEEAYEWHRRMSERIALEHAAKTERNKIRKIEKFERHGVDPAALAQMQAQAQLKAISGLRNVYFVKKQMRHMPERARYVLGFALGD